MDRATLKLADFGNVTFAGNTSQPGFGSIEQKVKERQREQVIQYDVSSNLQMGKFFKQESRREHSGICQLFKSNG